MLSKRPVDKAKRVVVTFSHPIDRGVHTAALVGEFNGWSTDAHPMTVESEQCTCELTLDSGRCYRFRYLINGDRWENDWHADHYTANDFGGEDSVVDLTDVATAGRDEAVEAPTKPTRRRAAKAAPATKKIDA